jgi:hypothetical protein
MQQIACLMVNPPQLVSKLMQQMAKQLDTVKLYDLFPPIDVHLIHNIPISTRVQHDFLAWRHDKKDFFQRAGWFPALRRGAMLGLRVHQHPPVM